MRWKMIPALLVSLSILTPACAAKSETDAALSVYGAFSGAVSGNGTSQSPANAAGGMIELRHLVHPWLGYEATYSFNQANQNYSSQQNGCPLSSGCPIEALTVSANAHEITGDWVFSVKALNLRPFALVGAGLLIDVPTSGTAMNACSPIFGSPGSPVCAPTSTSTKPVFVYGAGLDWGLLPHLGLRFQYRGNLYKAAALTTAVQSTGAFMHTAEPMIGAYFRF